MTPLFEDHLSLDAVVAFADGELSLVAYQRAAAHLERCPSCAAEVAEQTSARECLRRAGTPPMPGSLFDQLRSIPIGLEMSSPPPGPDEHRGRITRSRGFRMGAGFLLAGIAVTTLATAAGSDRPSQPNPFARPGLSPAFTVVATPGIQQVARRLPGG
jgi:anti-sigma factor RsiW